MIGRRRVRGGKLNLFAAIDVVLVGGSKLKAEDCVVSPGRRGGCSVSGSSEDLALIGVRFESLRKHGATLQPRLNAVLVISATSGGELRSTFASSSIQYKNSIRGDKQVLLRVACDG